MHVPLLRSSTNSTHKITPPQQWPRYHKNAPTTVFIVVSKKIGSIHCSLVPLSAGCTSIVVQLGSSVEATQLHYWVCLKPPIANPPLYSWMYFSRIAAVVVLFRVVNAFRIYTPRPCRDHPHKFHTQKPNHFTQFRALKPQFITYCGVGELSTSEPSLTCAHWTSSYPPRPCVHNAFYEKIFVEGYSS